MAPSICACGRSSTSLLARLRLSCHSCSRRSNPARVCAIWPRGGRGAGERGQARSAMVPPTSPPMPKVIAALPASPTAPSTRSPPAAACSAAAVLHLASAFYSQSLRPLLDPLVVRVELELGAVALQLRPARRRWRRRRRAAPARPACPGGAQVVTGSKQVVVRGVEPLERRQVGRLDLLGDRHQGLGPFDDARCSGTRWAARCRVVGPSSVCPAMLSPAWIFDSPVAACVFSDRHTGLTGNGTVGPVSGVASGRSSRSVGRLVERQSPGVGVGGVAGELGVGEGEEALGDRQQRETRVGAVAVAGGEVRVELGDQGQPLRDARVIRLGGLSRGRGPDRSRRFGPRGSW